MHSQLPSSRCSVQGRTITGVLASAAASASAKWYEDFRDKMRLAPHDFAYSYLGRSGRMDDARLRELAPEFMREYDEYRQKNLE